MLFEQTPSGSTRNFSDFSITTNGEDIILYSNKPYTFATQIDVNKFLYHMTMFEDGIDMQNVIIYNQAESGQGDKDID